MTRSDSNDAAPSTGGCGPACACNAAVPRRAFLQRGALGAVGALVASACGDRDIGGTYPTDPFPTTPLTVRIADFPALATVGGSARVDGGSAKPVAVVRTAANSYTALSLVCPHQGATVDVSGTGFKCPSHLAEFAADGTWIGGKQTGDLTILGLTLDATAGTLTINGVAAAAPPPGLLVAPTSEVFSAVQGQASPAAQVVAITNVGGGSLTGLSTQVAYAAGQATGWLTAKLSATTAPATLTLTPSTSALGAGAYSATVQVLSPTATNAPIAVNVSLLVSPVAAPAIALATKSVAMTATQGGADPAPQNVAITNAASGTLSGLAVGTIAYTGGGSGWLVAALGATTAPASVTLTASVGSLAVGSHTATVPITGTGASNSPQQLSVTLTVTSATAVPTLAFSITSVALAAVQGGAASPSQVVTIINAGSGALGALALGTIVYGSGGTGWLAATLAAGASPPTLTLVATPGSLAMGTYTATIPVTSAGVANSPQSVTVTLTVTAAASITLSASSSSFSAPLGSSPGGQVVNITSPGGAVSGLAIAVTYAGTATGWLSTSTLSATTTPSALTLRVVSTTLATGTYTATVQVTGTGVATKSVAVTLVIGPTGLPVIIGNWPALANVGGIAGSVGTVQGTPTAVVRTGANTFAAFSMRCTHQGTTIRIENWKSTGSAFHCPNHDALFDAKGALLPASPQKTTNLVARTVTYTAGDTTLYIS